MKYLSFLIFIFSFELVACATSDNRSITSNESSMKLRSIQSRHIESDDKFFLLRNIMATLQDLGFVIDKTDIDLGTVTATRFENAVIKMTVTAREISAGKFSVRANANYDLQPITDPKPYQDFFSLLAKSLFIDNQKIE